MKPNRPLPKNRTLEQIRNHYAVEKSIATRLKRADREERRRIYATMYDELFARVPDHPRLTRRRSEALTREANQDKLALVADLIDPSKVFVEFAPGDCRFFAEVAGRVRHVYGVGIWDQRERVACAIFGLCERVLSLVPKRYTRKPARYLTPTLVDMAVK